MFWGQFGLSLHQRRWTHRPLIRLIGLSVRLRIRANISPVCIRDDAKARQRGR
ncbi:hypothetical protein USDA257_c11490 [Sinorhizobium fredii USDA 257]|uniref:Uncharacterized protein n=1 Tax=Sinorhizobium fredii (strain USDA 257) TaxID=1185652 RepID=I3X1I4_SINF2|nr:hypothetical protein USDA257_c11490 [Sinorhizobium fredii USDA 257]